MASANATGTATIHIEATTKSYASFQGIAKAARAWTGSRPMYQPAAHTIWKTAKTSAQHAAA
jgi:hypothetical protein